MRHIAFIVFLSLLFACQNNRHPEKIEDAVNTPADTGKKKENESQPVMSRYDSSRTVSATRKEDISFANGRRPAYLEAKPFWVGGKIKNGGLGNIILDRLGPNADIHPIYTQTATADGFFGFAGNISQPELMELRPPLGAIHFIAHPGDSIYIEFALDKPYDYTVTNSKESAELKEMYLILEAANDKKDALEEAINAATTKEIKNHLYETRSADYSRINHEKYNNLIAFIKRVDTDFVGILAALRLPPNEQYDFMAELDKKYAPRYKDTEFYKSLHEKVNIYAAIAMGHEAPEIISTDANGKSVRLSSLRGKYVLLNFWASWHDGDLKDMADLKRNYEKYKAKGLEVFNFSLDKDRSAWLTALEKIGAGWINASDLLGFNTPTATNYAVSEIPWNLLLDKNGKIIARNLHGTELEKKLREVLR